MAFRKLSSHVFLVGVFSLVGAVGSASAQTIVVTAKPAANLAADLEYLIKQVAPEDDPTAQAILGALNQFQAGAMIKGLDQGRGFGLAVTLPKEFPQGGPSTVVAAVPVSDLGQFLDSLKDLGLTVDDQPGVAGFSHKVSMPAGNPTAYVLQSKGHALFSLVPGGADELRALDASSWKPKGRAETALSMKIQLSELPDAFKDQVLNGMEARAVPDRELRPGEKEADYRARLAGQNLAYDAVKSMMRDGDMITLDLDLNRETSEVALDISVSSRPNTSMEKTLRDFSSRRSHFQKLSKDAVAAAWANLPMAKELWAALTSNLEQAQKKNAGRMSPEEEQLLTRLIELVKSNLNAPEMDLGIAIQETTRAGSGAPRFAVLGGLRVQKGQEFERLARDAVAKLKPDEKVKITFDVAKATDGTAIHQLTGPFDDPDANLIKTFGAGPVKLFGKVALFFAFREDAILFSFAENGSELLRRALDGFSAPPTSDLDKSIGMVIRMAQMEGFVDKDQKAFHQAAGQAFRGESARRDRIQFNVKGDGGGARAHCAINVPVLKALAAIATENRR